MLNIDKLMLMINYSFIFFWDEIFSEGLRNFRVGLRNFRGGGLRNFRGGGV